MTNEVDCPEVPPSDDHTVRAWSKVRSVLHESGHRFNSQYAQQKYAGLPADPRATLEYLETQYERTVAMAVKTVTDHESAIACCAELDLFWKKFLKISSMLLRRIFPQNNQKEAKVLCKELRRRLLPRSEHWKAEAHKLVRQIQRKRSPSLNKKRTALGNTKAPGVGAADSAPLVVRIIRTAMQQEGLNPPKLASKIQAILRRNRQTKTKVDRTTVYRIVEGRTKRPQPAIRNALIQALQLKGEYAIIVSRELGAQSQAGPPQATSEKNITLGESKA